MIETSIINCLKADVELREGHGSTFSGLKKLRPGDIYTIRYELHATRRQYMIVGPDERVRVLQCDYITEYSVVKVVETTDEHGNWMWTLDPSRRLSKAQSGDQGASTGSLRRKWNKLLGRGGND